MQLQNTGSTTTATLTISINGHTDGTPTVTVVVRVGPDGTVLSKRVTRASGRPEWDAAVLRAIDAAITRWMGWKIDRSTAREHGIPKGLPYLTGFVGLYEIMAEAE